MLPWGDHPDVFGITPLDYELKFHVFKCKDPFCSYCLKIEAELPF